MLRLFSEKFLSRNSNLDFTPPILHTETFINHYNIIIKAIAICLATLLLFSCGGGGGGGAVAFQDKPGTHNGGGGSGWGKGASVGNGIGGSGGLGSGGDTEITITGNTTLNVTSYTYNGTTYSDITSLMTAMVEAGISEDITYVDFMVDGETAPRKARIRANSAANPSDDITFDYQYQATYTLPADGGAGPTQTVFYYKNDGVPITLPPLSDSEYVTEDGVTYHANKWKIGSNLYSPGNVSVPAVGDVTISTIEKAPDKTYGFDGGTLVVNKTSGTIQIKNDSQPVTSIQLPASGNVTLDLSSTTAGVDFAGTETSPGVTNPASLIAVTMSPNVYIGDYGFYGCSNLTTIDLSNCDMIRHHTFAGCTKLSCSLNLPNCTRLSPSAFEGCTNLSGAVSMPSCTQVSEHAFKDCQKITSVSFPACTWVGSEAFKDCPRLVSADLSGCTSVENAIFSGCTSLKTANLSGCSALSPSVFTGCTALESVNLSGCINIAEDTFNGFTSLKTVTVSSACTEIKDRAFNGCNKLESIDISSCTMIGESAFEGCARLGSNGGSVTFGSGLTTIEQAAFQGVPGPFYFNRDPSIPSPSGGIFFGTDGAAEHSVFNDGVTAYWTDGGGTTHTYIWQLIYNRWYEI